MCNIVCNCSPGTTSTSFQPLVLSGYTYSVTVGVNVAIFSKSYRVEPNVKYEALPSLGNGVVVGTKYPDVNVTGCVMGNKSSASSTNITLT